MIELRSFIKALKISWLQRILQQSKTCEWSNLSNINFQIFFSVGGNFASKLSDKTYIYCRTVSFKLQMILFIKIRYTF